MDNIHATLKQDQRALKQRPKVWSGVEEKNAGKSQE